MSPVTVAETFRGGLGTVEVSVIVIPTAVAANEEFPDVSVTAPAPIFKVRLPADVELVGDISIVNTMLSLVDGEPFVQPPLLPANNKSLDVNPVTASEKVIVAVMLEFFDAVDAVLIETVGCVASAAARVNDETLPLVLPDELDARS